MYRHLFEQAIALATLDARKPKQVNLRRAISATYYAVFHHLIDDACRTQMGAQHQQAPYRDVLARAFNHSTMRSACNAFLNGNLKASATKGLPLVGGRYVIPPAIRNIAFSFVELQEKRHLADYDRGESFRRSDVLTLIEETMRQVDDFVALPASNDRTFFLCCLWAYKELANR